MGDTSEQHKGHFHPPFECPIVHRLLLVALQDLKRPVKLTGEMGSIRMAAVSTRANIEGRSSPKPVPQERTPHFVLSVSLWPCGVKNKRLLCRQSP